MFKVFTYSDLTELEEWSSDKERSRGAVGGMFLFWEGVGRGGSAGGGILPLSFREELPVNDL